MFPSDKVETQLQDKWIVGAGFFIGNMINQMNNNRQIDKKTTKQVRIDAGLHQMLKVKAAKAGVSIRTLLEGYLANLLELKNEE